MTGVPILVGISIDIFIYHYNQNTKVSAFDILATIPSRFSDTAIYGFVKWTGLF